MKTFRELTESLIDFLKNKLPEVHVEFGKFGELPALTPALLIYAEPYRDLKNSEGYKSVRFVKFTVFALESVNGSTEKAIFNSFELLETVEDLIEEFERTENLQFSATDNPVAFDAVYDDIAVCYLEFISLYKRHQDA